MQAGGFFCAGGTLQCSYPLLGQALAGHKRSGTKLLGIGNIFAGVCLINVGDVDDDCLWYKFGELWA